MKKWALMLLLLGMACVIYPYIMHQKQEKEIFIYQVDSKKVIDPSEVDVLNDTHDKNEITLITCTVTGTKRLSVKGHRIS